MSGREFRPGELVDITIKGARVLDPGPDDDPADVRAAYDVWLSVNVNADAPTVTVERVAPADWPPRPGDVWRDRDGEAWFAQDDGCSDQNPTVMTMVPARRTTLTQDPEIGYWHMQAARFLRFRSPVGLVYREPEGEAS